MAGIVLPGKGVFTVETGQFALSVPCHPQVVEEDDRGKRHERKSIQTAFLPFHRLAFHGPDLYVPGSYCAELGLAFPSHTADLVLVDLAGADETFLFPVEHAQGVVVVPTSAQQEPSGRGETQVVNFALVELIVVGEGFEGFAAPHETVDALGFSHSGHLPSGRDLLIRVHGQTDHVVVVRTEKLLSISVGVQYHAQTGLDEEDLVVF